MPENEFDLVGTMNGFMDNDIMKKISVIGLGLSIDDLTQKHMRIISGADLVVGGSRHLSFFKDIQADTHTITKDINASISLIKRRMKNEHIVVLASGDPMFYGIGSTLVREIGKEYVKVYSNISSVSAAFAAINESWHDAKIISLHGRSCKDLKEIFVLEDKIAFLTDKKHNPAWLAKQIISMQYPSFRMYVFEKLGGSNEKILSFEDINEPATMTFSMPNVVILLRSTSQQTGNFKRSESAATDGNMPDSAINPHAIYPGMPTNVFCHENGLITKPEVRSVVISKLQLTSNAHTLWDLGAGSGSVSIEASRFLSKGTVIAVEKNENRIALIHQNIKKFSVSNVSVLHAGLPLGMEKLPSPHRIFIGGGGQELQEIIKTAAERLCVNGIMVINTVLLQTMEMARKALGEMGFSTELIQLQVSVSRKMPFGERMEALNPVWIVTGIKGKIQSGCESEL